MSEFPRTSAAYSYPHNGMWGSIKRAAHRLISDFLRDHPELRDKRGSEIKGELEWWALEHDVEFDDWPYRIAYYASNHQWGAFKRPVSQR